MASRPRWTTCKWLGVDAIWITPCFPSPQVDFGYDVSDYENIDPMYGTLADFDRMEKIGKQDGVRIIFDFVVNHTSDQHKWFLESESSKTNPVSRLVHLARWQGPEPATEQLDLDFSVVRPGSSTGRPTSTITTISIRNSPT